MKSQYKFRERTCLGCGAIFSGHFPEKRKYCSRSCFESSERPNRKTGVWITCKTCSAQLYRHKFRSENAFCDKVCHDKFQSRNKIIRVCKTCGTTFYWSQSRLKQLDPKYCSVKCRNASAEWKQNAVIAGNLKLQQSKLPTRLECSGAFLLRDLGVAYKEQVLVANKFIVDVLIPTAKIVIQWDGDYWHGYRSEGDIRPLDHRQKRRVALDGSQDAYLRQCGYKVLRFWEHEVFKQREKVI